MLVPVAVAGLAGHLPLGGLVVAAFLLETATSYFAPAYGAPIPALVDRENVQRRTRSSRRRAGALDRRLGASPRRSLAVLPISVFFAVNAGSFLVSAALIARHPRRGAAAPLARGGAAHPRRARGAASAPRRWRRR